MISAIIKASKPADARPLIDLAAPRDLPMAEAGCCGGDGLLLMEAARAEAGDWTLARATA